MSRLEFLRSDSAALVSIILAMIAMYYLARGGVSTGTAPYYAISAILWVWLLTISYNFSMQPMGRLSRIVIGEVATLLVGFIIYLILPASLEGSVVPFMIKLVSALLVMLLPISVVIWLLRTLRIRFQDSLPQSLRPN